MLIECKCEYWHKTAESMGQLSTDNVNATSGDVYKKNIVMYLA